MSREKDIEPGRRWSFLDVGNRPSEVLGLAAKTLGIQPAFPGGVGRKCFAACPGSFCCLADQVDQPANGVLTVLFLSAVLAGMNYEKTFFSYSLTRQAYETSSNVFRQRGRIAYMETNLHGSGDLVDILAARTGRADKAFLYFVLAN